MHNNPLIYVDPSGHKVWLIHGTFSTGDTWTPDFVKYVEGLFNESSEKLNWTGKNSTGARSDAAEESINKVYEWHSKNPDEPIRLVGHSHGGNVAILLANLLEKKGKKVEILITVANAVREYKLDTKVGQHIQMRFDHGYGRRNPSALGAISWQESRDQTSCCAARNGTCTRKGCRNARIAS